MTIQELHDILGTLDEESEVIISLFKADGTVQAFEIDGIDADFGLVHIDISEDEGITY